jgi:hypothetical protein
VEEPREDESSAGGGVESSTGTLEPQLAKRARLATGIRCFFIDAGVTDGSEETVEGSGI